MERELVLRLASLLAAAPVRTDYTAGEVRRLGVKNVAFSTGPPRICAASRIASVARGDAIEFAAGNAFAETRKTSNHLAMLPTVIRPDMSAILNSLIR